MARKIKNYKKKEKKITKEEVDKNIEKGMITIYNVCGKEVYEKMKLLKLDSSLVITEAFDFINQAYRMSMMHKTSIKNGDYNKLKYNVNLFLKKYYKYYKPSMPMGLYSIFFMFNKIIEQYAKMNDYKKLFKDNSNDLYNINNYSDFNKIFNIKIGKNDFDPMYDKKQMQDFMHISELLKYNLSILDKYREKLFNEKQLKENVLKAIVNIDLLQVYKNDFNTNIIEYDMLNKLMSLCQAAKIFISHKVTLGRMKVVKPFDLELVNADINFIKKSICEIELFLNRMILFIFQGEEIRNPLLIKTRIKEIEIKNTPAKKKRA
jgi:hypothetical protein